jgi:hypothetical protein
MMSSPQTTLVGTPADDAIAIEMNALEIGSQSSKSASCYLAPDDRLSNATPVPAPDTSTAPFCVPDADVDVSSPDDADADAPSPVDADAKAEYEGLDKKELAALDEDECNYAIEVCFQLPITEDVLSRMSFKRMRFLGYLQRPQVIARAEGFLRRSLHRKLFPPQPVQDVKTGPQPVQDAKSGPQFTNFRENTSGVEDIGSLPSLDDVSMAVNELQALHSDNPELYPKLSRKGMRIACTTRTNQLPRLRIKLERLREDVHLTQLQIARMESANATDERVLKLIDKVDSVCTNRWSFDEIKEFGIETRSQRAFRKQSENQKRRAFGNFVTRTPGFDAKAFQTTFQQQMARAFSSMQIDG